MKKSSIAPCLLVCVLLLASGAARAASSCVTLASAPETHTVQAGDTLWDIAARFLRDPWCWRAVWSDNREHISNPHWIFPGQRLMLDRAHAHIGASPLPAEATVSDVVKLSPTVRASAVSPFSLAKETDTKQLTIKDKYRLVSMATLSNAARIAGSGDGRRLLRVGDVVQVNGPPLVGDSFDVMRPLTPLKDDQIGPALALPLKRIGQVRRQVRPQDNTSQQFVIALAEAELVEGDVLLLARTKSDPLPPPQVTPALQAKILAVMRDGQSASQYDVLALNRGSLDGLRPGNTVEITLPDKIELDEYRARSSESMATLWVFEVADHVALALIMRSRAVLDVGSLIQTASPGDR